MMYVCLFLRPVLYSEYIWLALKSSTSQDTKHVQTKEKQSKLRLPCGLRQFSQHQHG